MSARAAVTTIVATRNRPELAEAALRSLVAASEPRDQLIVVESGDGDVSATLATMVGPELLHLRSTIKGKSYKLNRAVERASHEILLFTDDDAVVLPSWCAAMAEAFSDSRVGIAFGPVVGLTQHGEGDHHPAAVPIGEAPLTTWDYAHGAAMAVRAEALWEIGGFDERLGPGAPAHGEEHDVLLRLREHGWHAQVVDAPPVAHVEWRSQTERDANLLVYERGGGAFLGAALRRHPFRWSRLAYLRSRYQLSLLRRSPLGLATLRAFVGGLWYGLRMRERRWLQR